MLDFIESGTNHSMSETELLSEFSFLLDNEVKKQLQYPESVTNIAYLRRILDATQRILMEFMFHNSQDVFLSQGTCLSFYHSAFDSLFLMVTSVSLVHKAEIQKVIWDLICQSSENFRSFYDSSGLQRNTLNVVCEFFLFSILIVLFAYFHD